MGTIKDFIKRIAEGKRILSLDVKDIESLYMEGREPVVQIGHGVGFRRLEDAVMESLNSPDEICLSHCHGFVFCIFIDLSAPHPLQVSELEQLNWLLEDWPSDILRNVKWGIYVDDSLGDSVEVAIVVG